MLLPCQCKKQLANIYHIFHLRLDNAENILFPKWVGSKAPHNQTPKFRAKGYHDVKFRLFSLLATMLIISSIVCSSQSKRPLGNQDVIDMVKAGLDERTISKAIETSETAFDTTPQTLILLKNAGVSDGILTAMLSGESRKPPPQSPIKLQRR